MKNDNNNDTNSQISDPVSPRPFVPQNPKSIRLSALLEIFIAHIFILFFTSELYEEIK